MLRGPQDDAAGVMAVTMIRNGPDAAALLRLVHQVLRDDLARFVPGSHRYELLLIGAALEIAAREAAAGDAPLREAHATLRDLLGEPAKDPPEGSGLIEELSRFSSKLASEIREGKRDGDERTHAAMIALSELSLAESNPKAVSGTDTTATKR